MAGLKTRIPPPVFGFGTALLMGWIDRAVPIARWPASPVNRLGWAVVVLGLGIDAYCALSFFMVGTTINPMRIADTTQLVTNGIYRWSRNPMYCGLIIALIGWGLHLGSSAALLAVIIFERFLVRFQIEPEEIALEARFGNDYRDYKRRVNRWIGGSRAEAVAPTVP